MLPVRRVFGRLLPVPGGRLLAVRAIFGRLLAVVGGRLLPVAGGRLLPVPAVLGRFFREAVRVVGGAGLRHEP